MIIKNAPCYFVKTDGYEPILVSGTIEDLTAKWLNVKTEHGNVIRVLRKAVFESKDDAWANALKDLADDYAREEGNFERCKQQMNATLRKISITQRALKNKTEAKSLTLHAEAKKPI